MPRVYLVRVKTIVYKDMHFLNEESTNTLLFMGELVNLPFKYSIVCEMLRLNFIISHPKDFVNVNSIVLHKYREYRKYCKP